MESKFKINQTVMHPEFGVGKVTKIMSTKFGFAIQIDGRFSDYENKFTHA